MADQQQQQQQRPPPPTPGGGTGGRTAQQQTSPAVSNGAGQHPSVPAPKPPQTGGNADEGPSTPLAIARDALHRTVAGLIMTVIAVCAVIVWPLDFIYSMPWQRVERARRPRATRENLADHASPYYRIGEHQVFYLQDVHIIPEAQKQALAHLEPNKKALGYREITEVRQEYGEKEAKMLRKYIMTDYKWLTLAQVDERITTLEKAFRELGVDYGHRVVIYAETRIEWFLCAHAVIRTGAAIATLYATLGDEGLKFGIDETKATILVTSEELLVRLPRLLYTGMKHLIYFPTLQKPTPKPPAALAELQAANTQISFISYAELMALGARSKAPSYSLATTRITPETPAVILYTSGSTGKPKGVVLTHANFVHTVKAVFTIITEEVVEAHDHHCWYSFLPLAHILEFIAENTIFCAGIKIGYGSPFTMTDLSTGIIKGQPGDLTLLKPTVIPGVPLVLERIRKTIFEKLSKRSPVLHYLALWLVDYKTFWLENGYQTPVFDWLVSTKFRAVFGGNVEYMLIGGAQLSPDTQRIMRALLNVQILIGYGSTETCGANMVMDLEDLSIGWTGAPLFGIKIRLVDWPEGGYTHADKPYPRGELHVGGQAVSPGYFEQEEQTKEAFYRDEKGVQWFRTGDIVEVNAAGLVHIIDRRKDLVKMQHGEYISLGKIESELKNCLIVDNVCVHADSKHPFVVALIMPNWKVVKGLAAVYLAEQEEKAKGGLSPSSGNAPNAETRSMIVRTASQMEPDTVEKVRTEPAFVAKVLAELQDFCRKETTLSRLETPARIYLCKEEWSPANELLTAALKIKRFQILHFYADQVAAMYASAE